MPQQSLHHKTRSSATLHSLSPPRLFSRSRSLNRLPNNNPDQDHSHPLISKARPIARSASSKEDGQELLKVALCSAEAEELPADFQLHRALKPLLNFKQIKNKDISNPYLFRGAPMVTTFVHSAGSRSKVVCRVVEKASRVNITLHYINILFWVGPHLCAPLFLLVAKIEVPLRRQRRV